MNIIIRYILIVFCIFMFGCTDSALKVPILKHGEFSGKIVFISDRDNELGQLYLINLEEINPKLISTNTLFNDDPILKFDGSIIYKGNISRNDSSSIMHISSDGKKVGQIIKVNNVSLYSPKITGDNKYVYFSKERAASTYIIIKHNLQDNKSQILVDKAGSSIFSISPDNKKVLYISSDGNDDILLKDFETGKIINLTQGKKYNYTPTWSPDGKNVAFISTRDRDTEVYIMDNQGKNVKRLTNNNYREGKPAWSPDGTKLVYNSYRQGDLFNGAQLYILDLKNLKEWQVTEAKKLSNGYFSTDEAPYWGK